MMWKTNQLITKSDLKKVDSNTLLVMTTKLIPVERDTLTQYFTAFEVSEICISICTHVLELLAIYNQDKPEALSKIHLHKTLIQFKMGVLGRIAEKEESSVQTIPISLRIGTKLYELEEDEEEIISEHKLVAKDMKDICPLTLIDALLLLLVESINSIRHRLPDIPRINTYHDDCISMACCAISGVKPYAKIASLPSRDTETGITSLCLVY